MLAALGTISSVLYWLYNQATDWFWRAFLVTVTVRKGDRPYDWIAAWLTTNRHQLISASNLTLSTKENEQSYAWHRRRNDDGDGAAEVNRKDLKLLPGEGLHVFKFKGKWCWLTRTIGQPQQNGFFGKPIMTETITVSMVGTSSAAIEDLFLDAWTLYQEEEKGGTKVYVLQDGYDWRLAMTRPPRPLESVVLDGDVAAHVVGDLKNFFASQAWYQERGIPWRRGVLLYGPPGTGKSSFITAVAGAVGMNICVLNLSNKQLDDESLTSRLMDAPAKSMLLLEDVDAVFVGRSVAATDDMMPIGAGGSNPSVSFSGLLNALDGVASQEGRVVFMTTNHIERLDPALIRPGRVDISLKFDLASAEQARRMFMRFFPSEHDLAARIGSVLSERAVSPAALQGHFLKHRDAPLEALSSLPTLLAAAKAVDTTPSSTMLISVWLKRLALPQIYGTKLNSMKVKFVVDLAILEHSEVLTVMDIKNEIHKARVTGFLEQKEFVKQAFALAKTNVIEKLFKKHCGNATSTQISQFVKFVAPDTLSSFEIEHYLSDYTERPSAALTDVDTLVESGGAVSTQSILKISKRYADLTVEQWLKSVGQADALAKFTEENVTDIDQVLQFGDTELREMGITRMGDLFRCTEDIKRRNAMREICA